MVVKHSINFSMITLWVQDNIKFIVLCVGGVIIIFLTTAVYPKLYLIVRRHKNQIQTLQVQQVTQTSE